MGNKQSFDPMGPLPTARLSTGGDAPPSPASLAPKKPNGGNVAANNNASGNNATPSSPGT
ncbi:hypothetical protein PINS_up012104 [Pythium insidiosum]|nr:hypothetical protein PINS_up012104 [Pythium insidiosum]